MVGYLSYTRENKGMCIARRRIGALPVLEVRLGREGRLWERMAARRAAKLLARRGVREVVFPEDYPHQDLFVRRGILPVETLPLYRAMAPLVVKQKMMKLGLSPGTTTAAVSADYVTAEIGALLRALALSVRYVILDGAGGEDCCAQLQREYGVSVIRRSSWESLEKADVLVLLRPPKAGEKAENPVLLHLYDGERVLCRNGVDFVLPQRILAQVEENCNQKQLLALLLREGILQNYQIPIMEVDIPGKSYYNASTVNNIE